MNFMSQTLYDFSVNDNANNSVSLEKYRGKTLLIVNTASKCGFTPQYDGLEELQKKYSEKDFSVLAFPCNQFGNQEPGSNEEIQEFCSINSLLNARFFRRTSSFSEYLIQLFAVFLTTLSSSRAANLKYFFASSNFTFNFDFLEVDDLEPIAERFNIEVPSLITHPNEIWGIDTPPAVPATFL